MYDIKLLSETLKENKTLATLDLSYDHIIDEDSKYIVCTTLDLIWNGNI